MPDKRKNRDATAPHRQAFNELKPVWPTVPPMPEPAQTPYVPKESSEHFRIMELSKRVAALEERMSRFDGGAQK